ncbi:MAG: hypothetical protein OXP71_04775 [Candidatus Poribacteria bacterium]|nr:hypothetical protein [Candidatus Poribacteria bacterium]
MSWQRFGNDRKSVGLRRRLSPALFGQLIAQPTYKYMWTICFRKLMALRRVQCLFGRRKVIRTVNPIARDPARIGA